MRLILIGLLAIAGCGPTIEDINRQVAEDAVKQYEMVERHGSAIDLCVQAGLVSAAYLQAKNDEQYRHWKVIEDVRCANAGIIS